MSPLLPSLLICLFVSGCSASRPACRTVAEEPVSTCRADAKCVGRNGWNAVATILAGVGSKKGEKNSVTAREEQCVQNDLDAQRANYYGSRGIIDPQRPQRCTSTRVSDDEVVTECR